MAGKITKRVVDDAVASDRDTFIWDSNLKGFGLKVTKNGHRSYIYQFRMGGRESTSRRYTIGSHGSPWTPTTARAEAERIAIQVAQGIDPVAAEKERRRQAVDLAFESYAALFAATCKGAGWRRMVDRSLKLYATPALKRKALPEIRRADIATMLDKIPPHMLATRRNTFAAVRRLFRWAVSRGDIERSPCEGMETPPPVTPRDRVLTDSELKLAWEAAGKTTRPFGPIVRLLIVTGQRREEVTGLDWSELDRREALWSLPKERSKNETGHLVPLSSLAVQILDEFVGGETWPKRGRVFPTSTGNAFTAHSRGKMRLDTAIAEAEGGETVPPWRLHDLRRTMATGFQKLGIRFEVTEAALNHLSGSRAGVAAVYQRHDWKDEKRAAFDAWGAHISNLLSA